METAELQFLVEELNPFVMDSQTRDTETGILSCLIVK